MTYPIGAIGAAAVAATTPTLAGGLTREVRPTGMAARRGARPTGRCSSPTGSVCGESLSYKMQTRLRYRRPLSLEPSNKGSTCTHNSCPTLDITTCCRSVQSPTAGATPPPRPLRKAASSSLPWAAKDADGDTLHGRPEQRKSVWQRKVGAPPLQVRVAAALFAAGLVHRDHDGKGEEDEMEGLERSDGRRGL